MYFVLFLDWFLDFDFVGLYVYGCIDGFYCCVSDVWCVVVGFDDVVGFGEMVFGFVDLCCDYCVFCL